MLENKQEAEKLSAQRRTAEILTLITFIMMTLTSVIAIFFVPSEEKTPIDNFMLPGIALSAGYSYYLARKGEHIRGIYILFSMIISATLLYPLASDGVGWQSSIGMLLITTSIANAVLPPSTAGRVSTVTFIFAILTIVIELFTTGLTKITPTASAIAVNVGLAVVYLGLIFYRFRLYTLRTKMLITFITLSILSIGVAGFAINRIITNELTNSVSQQLTNVANNASDSINNQLKSEINLMQTLASDYALRSRLTQRTPISDLTELENLDQQWRNAVSTNSTSDRLIVSVLQNQSAESLREFKTEFPSHAEVFVTDVYGANIASTDITSDYFQADEEWWQKAYNNGQGAVFISQPIFDESSQTLSVQMAVPIYDISNKTIIGILRSTVDLNILTKALELGRTGQTGETEIYLPDGSELELSLKENGEFELEIEEAPLDLIETLKLEQVFMDTLHEGEEVLVAQSKLGDSENPSEIFSAIQNLHWRIVTVQNKSEAFSAVTNSSRVSQIIGLVSIVIASLFAYLMTQYLTAPILRLTKTAEDVSDGNLEARAESNTPDEIGVLATSFNRMTDQLKDTLGTLEKRVAERTTDLELARHQSEKRTNQLFAIGEISKFINREQKQEILLPLITRLVSEQLGYYHIGIYLIDEVTQLAVLEASNSEGGQAMLKRGHKIKVGEKDIIGSVAELGTHRIALDFGTDSTTFNSPELPNTRSELALPLKRGNVTIGILDVQSNKPGDFTNDDVNILSILADQISIAIENARLFSQAQQSLAEVQLLYSQNLQENWKSFSREEGMIGYLQSLGKGKKLTELVDSEEIQQALNRGETKVNDSTIVVPIKLRGQVIGVMRIQSAEQKQWTTNEINLSEAVSERLSLALDNARLIQESQRQVIKEQTISEITSNIGSSINLENVLRIAVEELGRSIPGSEVVIKLQEENPDKVTG